MNPNEFAYWIRGYVEIQGPDAPPPTAAQWQIIKDHLDLVFTKVTPDYPYSTRMPDLPWDGTVSMQTC